MKLDECYGHLENLWSDELVVCSVGTASGEWYRHTESKTSFYLQASMGISSMFSLGIALSLPEARVWNFDGDGALVMNPGVLFTEAETRPRNLTHFVLANRVYGATACQPYANNRGIDFMKLADACGITRSYLYHDIEHFTAEIDDVLAEPEYAFVVLELEPPTSESRQEVPIDGPELKYLFANHIKQQFGTQVFSEWGY